MDIELKDKAPLGLGDTALPLAGVDKVGRSGGGGCGAWRPQISGPTESPSTLPRRPARKTRVDRPEGHRKLAGRVQARELMGHVCQTLQRITSLLHEAKTQVALVLDRLEERQG